MLRSLAVIFGVAFLVIGIIGFYPQFVDSNNLFGIFRFNFEYRMAHIFSGILGILCGLYSLNASKLYFIIIGIVYGILAILGFSQPNGMLLGMFENNRADSWFNTVLAAVSLLLGFSKK